MFAYETQVVDTAESDATPKVNYKVVPRKISYKATTYMLAGIASSVADTGIGDFCGTRVSRYWSSILINSLMHMNDKSHAKTESILMRLFKELYKKI